jgi:RHS repeat-associated protein
MKKITRNSGSSKADLEFGYDASGNRLWKKVTPKGSGAVISTYYYLRDAQGNEMCRYVKYTNTTSQLMYVAEEHSIYGSSRVGVDNRKDTLYKAGSYSPAWGGANTSRRALGLKSFELANHLGNVLVTVSDKPIYKVSSTTIHFNPEITSISDYYPFGAPIAGRSAAFGSEYRFGFNGKEDDGQVNGEGNSIDFGARMYDSRLGRFLSVDPLAADYPSLSPYVFVANNPINAIDPDGRKILFINGHYQDNWVGRNIVGSDKAGAAYWGDDMASSAQKFFKDYSNITSSNYINGSSKFAGDMSGQDRYKAGMAYAKANLEVLTADMGDGETFKMVTHSEGSAYGAGVAQYLLDQGYKVETVVHLSADEGDEFSTPTAPVTYQLGNDGDWVTGNKNIKGVDKSGIVNSGLSLRLVHGMTRNGSVFQNVIDLTTVRTQDNIGMVNGQAAAWKTQIPGTTTNGTDFTRINGAEIMDQDGTPKIK